MSSRPPSRLGRLARLGTLTGRISSSYLGEKVRDLFGDRDEQESKEALDRLHVDNAARLADTLGQLKGAAMKLGQSMAMAARTLDLPEEVSARLGTLHAQAEAVPFDAIKRAVEHSLGESLSDAYAWFDPKPLGTASLGQAHAARLHDGTEVVVKVLHEGVDKSVDTDLLALKTLFVGSRVLRREKAEVDAIFDEIRERLNEELDYLQEAVNIQAFQEIYRGDPRVNIPRIHPSGCTDRVLTLDRMPGVPLDAFLETATPEARQRAGVTLAQLYYEMAFRHRMLHADPHPGNYLFGADGTVSLLDFGCVKRFDEYWIANYARAALAGLDADRDRFIEYIRRIDAWHGDDPRAADVLWRFADTLSQPYRSGSYTIGTHEESILERLRPVVAEMTRYPELVMPRDLIYLHRSLGGLYAIARQLHVTWNWGGLLREHATYAIAYAEDRLRG